MKKRLTFFISIMLILTLLAPTILSIPASATYNDELEFESDIVYLVNVDKGTVIFNKNANKKTAMASLTKLTTCIVVLENCDDLDAEVTVKQSVLDTLAGTNSSTAGITTGEILTVRELLYLMMVKSANEASCILADYVAGDIDTFIDMMNELAEKVGCKNTHYTNTHGLDDDDHYTTAADLAKILEYGLKNETFKEIIGTQSYTLKKTNKRDDDVIYSNTNTLLNSASTLYYYEPCKGGKTGSTTNAGHCLASYATKNGYTYICVVINAPYQDTGKGYKVNYAFRESIFAYEWAFENMKLKTVASTTDVVTDIPVSLARKTDHVRLVPAEDVTALIPASAEESSILVEAVQNTLATDVKAPVKAGTKLGTAEIKYAGETIATVDLVAGEDVSRSIIATIGYGIKCFLTSTFMKVIYILIATCILIIILLRYYNKNVRRNARVKVVSKKGKPKVAPNTQYRRRYKRQTEVKRKKR